MKVCDFFWVTNLSRCKDGGLVTSISIFFSHGVVSATRGITHCQGLAVPELTYAPTKARNHPTCDKPFLIATLVRELVSDDFSWASHRLLRVALSWPIISVGWHRF